MNKKNWLVYVVHNIICVVCWTALAIIFNKWWLALFALLFLVIPKGKMKYYRVCDGCGRHSPKADSYNEALDKAKEAGWVHYADGNKDYCPSCEMEF